MLAELDQLKSAAPLPVPVVAGQYLPSNLCPGRGSATTTNDAVGYYNVAHRFVLWVPCLRLRTPALHNLFPRV